MPNSSRKYSKGVRASQRFSLALPAQLDNSVKVSPGSPQRRLSDHYSGVAHHLGIISDYIAGGLIFD